MVVTPEEIGNYDIACAEYCGMNHSLMYSKLIVVSQADFDKWIETGLPVKEETPRDTTAVKDTLSTVSN